MAAGVLLLYNYMFLWLYLIHVKMGCSSNTNGAARVISHAAKFSLLAHNDHVLALHHPLPALALQIGASKGFLHLYGYCISWF
jgi:hypothetical protein